MVRNFLAVLLFVSVAYCVAGDLQCVMNINPKLDGESEEFAQALQACYDEEVKCLDEADLAWRTR